MDELQRIAVKILTEEHQDWVKHIQDAEEKGVGIDLNLGGGFAERMNKLLVAFSEFNARGKKKKGKGIFS